jgi:hypothetical protein
MRTRRNKPSALSRLWLSASKRLARPQQQLALNDVGLSSRVADDEHVVDDRLRTLANVEHDVHARTVLALVDADSDVRARIAAIEILEQNRIAIEDHPGRVERPAWS